MVVQTINGRTEKKLKKLTPSALRTKENPKTFQLLCISFIFPQNYKKKLQESMKSIQKIRKIQNAFYCNESFFLFYCYYEHPYTRLFNSSSRQE